MIFSFLLPNGHFFTNSSSCAFIRVTAVSAFFIFVLSIVLFISWGVVGTDVPQLVRGALWGFVDTKMSDMFNIIGMIGAVVMPHNLYLHSGENSCHHVCLT